MTVRPTFTGPAAVPVNLVATLSPATTAQSTPGGQVLTASATGGTGAISWAWVATYSDGSSAAALLSGSGASRTLTTTAYWQVVAVTATATDSGWANQQVASASAVVSVGAAPALVSGGDLTATQLNAGTTSQAFTFAAATGGGGSISYTLSVESSTGAVTLSTSSGRTANLLGLTDGATVRVTCTATDAVGQSVTSTGVWGVATAPVYDEVGLWNVVEEVNCQTLGSGSRTGSGALVVGGTTFTVNYAGAGTPSNPTLTVDSNGARVSQTSGSGTVTNAYLTFPVGLLNFSPIESILCDYVVEVASMPTGGIFACGFGDGTAYNANDFFGLQSGAASSTDVGNWTARRWQSGAATTYTLATSQQVSGTYSVQVLMVGQRISLVSMSRQSDYLGGPKLGTESPMRGAYTGSPGGSGITSGASIASAFTSLRISWAVISGASSVTLKKARLSRLTRPPSV